MSSLDKKQDESLKKEAAQQLALIFVALLDNKEALETTQLSPGRSVGDKKA